MSSVTKVTFSQLSENLNQEDRKQMGYFWIPMIPVSEISCYQYQTVFCADVQRTINVVSSLKS